MRLKPAQATATTSWRYVPNEDQGGHGIPALPFILGDFAAARLLVIAEGQWDAITFAHAAGWLSHDAAWPDSICVLGIRGASGVNPFLHHYGPLWQKGVNCLLLVDSDAAGTTWFTSTNGRPSFAHRLQERCELVCVEGVKSAKDFNEAWKRGLITQGDIGRLLATQTLTDCRGAIL